MKEITLNGKNERIYNYVKKIIKIILIILFYVIMFWGIFKLVWPVKHETKCQCSCDLATFAELKKESNESTEEIPEEDVSKEEVKEEPKKEEKPKVEQTVKVTPKADKETYQAYAYDLVINQYLWSEADYEALVKLWTRESDWNPNAVNKSSGACNIPQALPCSKISNMYGDNSWESGIKWGLVYISNRYGTPTKAWQHFQNKNWY